MVLTERAEEPESDAARRGVDPRIVWVLVGLVAAIGLVLRLWSISHGLPAVYNPDELRHFADRAVDFHLTGDLDPEYFVNPPAITYLFWVVFAVWFGGSGGVAEMAATDPSAAFLVARVTVAVIGAGGTVLMFALGRRLFGNRVGLVAALVMAVAFLPVHWSHFATNDVAAMVAATLSLLGTAMILKSPGWKAYLVAGAGLGIAAGTKYTAGIVLVALLTAAFFDWRADRRRAVLGVAVAGVASVVTFLLAVPSLVVDTQSVLDELNRLNLPGEGSRKIGQAQENGHVYYSWVLTWGLGWLACAAAVLGAVWLAVRDHRAALVLIPTPVLYVLFMGGQPAFFGRWLLPVFPFIVLLAAFGTVRATDVVARRLRWSPVPVLAVLTALVCAQSLIHVVHMNRALGRTDTRTMAMEWMQENIPPGDAFVDQYLLTPFLVDRDVVEARWEIVPMDLSLSVDRVRPPRIDRWQQEGVCWVSALSQYYGRVFRDENLRPKVAPFYRALEERGEVVFHASSYRPGKGPVPFNFDWASNLYPFDYERPGGDVTIYRLPGGRCAEE